MHQDASTGHIYAKEFLILCCESQCFITFTYGKYMTYIAILGAILHSSVM